MARGNPFLSTFYPPKLTGGCCFLSTLIFIPTVMCIQCSLKKRMYDKEKEKTQMDILNHSIIPTSAALVKKVNPFDFDPGPWVISPAGRSLKTSWSAVRPGFRQTSTASYFWCVLLWTKPSKKSSEFRMGIPLSRKTFLHRTVYI